MTTNNGSGPGKAASWLIGGVLVWALLPQETRAKITGWFQTAFEQEAARERADRQAALAEQERQRQLREAQAILDLFGPPLAPEPPHFLQVSIPSAIAPAPGSPVKALTPAIEPDAGWRQKIVHPSILVILGKRGSGKSALGYRLLELHRYQLRPYVVGVPNAARTLLPEWIGIAPALADVPPKAIALIDEAYILYHARATSTSAAKVMSQLLNLSRQKEQTIIFVSQESRQVDINVASAANSIAFKEPSALQMEFERGQLQVLAGKARDAFAAVTGDRHRWSYLYAPDTDFAGMLDNELPSFWTPRLSRLFAAEATAAPQRVAAALTPAEKAARAKGLRVQGQSYQQIADALGVTRGTVVNYLKGYPYKQ